MVGVVSSPLHDMVLMNRVSDGAQTASAGNVLMTRFFRANFLSQLTNAQRRAVLAGSFYTMRDLARVHAGLDLTTPKGRADTKVIEADFRDYGVSDDNMAGFLTWVGAKDSLPSLDDLNSAEGQQFAASAACFVDQTIQNPRRADKAALALTPFGRLSFGLTSFLYAFYRNAHAYTWNRMQRNAEIAKSEGLSPALAYQDAVVRAGAGLTLILAGQMLAGTIRAAMMPRLNGISGRGYDSAPPELKPTIMLAAKVEHATRRARANMRGEKT